MNFELLEVLKTANFLILLNFGFRCKNLFTILRKNKKICIINLVQISIIPRKELSQMSTNELKKHEELRQLAIYVYDVKKNKLPEGWKLIETEKILKTVFMLVWQRKGMKLQSHLEELN